MIDVYKHGSIVGVSISGMSAIFLILYLAFEFSSISLTSMFLIGKIIYYIKVRRYIKSIIPDWWKVKVKFILIRKTDQLGPLTGSRVVEVPIKVYYRKSESQLNGSVYSYMTQTYSTIDYVNIIDERIDERVKHHILEFISDTDKKNGINKKQMNRNKALSKLGIK